MGGGASQGQSEIKKRKCTESIVEELLSLSSCCCLDWGSPDALFCLSVARCVKGHPVVYCQINVFQLIENINYCIF